jgi:hypothetical protein
MAVATDSQKISGNWKRACSIYPIYMELSQLFELGIAPCSDLESPSAQTSNEALVRAEQWFREADRLIEVHHIRKLLNRAPLDEKVLHDILTRHLGKEPKSESDRDKIDFLLVQYLAQCLPAGVSAHELSLEQAAEVLRPILGDASQPKAIPPLEKCIEDLNHSQGLADFMDHMILERGRALKVAGKEKPFDPSTLVAFTRFSFLARLGTIRLVHEDILGLDEDLRALEKAGVKKVDCSPAELSKNESLASIRKMREKWKQSFPGKYSQNYWFTDVVRVRACVKSELERLAGKKPGEESAGSDAAPQGKSQEGGLQTEVERYIQQIAEEVKSIKEARAANAIKLGDVRLMLSAEEVEAFRHDSGEINLLLHRLVAVRALLLAALEKPDKIDPEAAKALAQSEATALQERIAAAKEKGETDVMVNLTAYARSLQKALDKDKKTKSSK